MGFFKLLLKAVRIIECNFILEYINHYRRLTENKVILWCKDQRAVKARRRLGLRIDITRTSIIEFSLVVYISTISKLLVLSRATALHSRYCYVIKHLKHLCSTHIWILATSWHVTNTLFHALELLFTPR